MEELYDTQGASLLYRRETGPVVNPEGHWLLYTGPLRIDNGEVGIRANAIRIGYAESEEASATFVIG